MSATEIIFSPSRCMYGCCSLFSMGVLLATFSMGVYTTIKVGDIQSSINSQSDLKGILSTISSELKHIEEELHNITAPSPPSSSPSSFTPSCPRGSAVLVEPRWLYLDPPNHYIWNGTSHTPNEALLCVDTSKEALQYALQKCDSSNCDHIEILKHIVSPMPICQRDVDYTCPWNASLLVTTNTTTTCKVPESFWNEVMAPHGPNVLYNESEWSKRVTAPCYNNDAKGLRWQDNGGYMYNTMVCENCW